MRGDSTFKSLLHHKLTLLLLFYFIKDLLVLPIFRFMDIELGENKY